MNKITKQVDVEITEDDLNKFKNNDLHSLLTDWFNENENNIKSNKNFWKRNKIGKLLKDNLKQLNHWKNKTIRNNPKGNIESLVLAREIKNKIEKEIIKTIDNQKHLINSAPKNDLNF